MSATNSSRAWDLRCFIREKLVQFLQEQYPECLPKNRAEVSALTSQIEYQRFKNSMNAA